MIMGNRWVGLGVAVLLLIGLAACGGGNANDTNAGAGAGAGIGAGSGNAAKDAADNAANNAGTGAEAPVDGTEGMAGETHTYTGLYGDVTVPVQPQKLLVTSTRYAEYLIEMGVVPQMLLYAPLVEPDYRADYFTSHGVELIEYPQYEQNFELLLTLGPDMIVGQGLGMDEKAYEQLSKIAPTVPVNAGPAMEEAMPLLAELFGKEAEYERIKAAFAAKAEEAKAQLAEAIGEQTVMVLRVDPKQYRFLGQHAVMGSSQLFYKQLGLTIPPALADAPDWFTPFSLEVLPEIDPDFIFIERRIAEDTDASESWDQLMASSLWQGLKAVQAGRVFPLATNDFVQGEGPVGYAYLIDYIVSSLAPDSGGE